MESMLTLAHLQQRRSRRWLFGLTLLLLVTLLISLCAGSNGSRPASGSAPKVSCLSGRSACREPAVLLVGRRWRSPGRLCRRCLKILWRSRGCWGLQRRGRRADCRRPAGQRSLARLGARPVCHLWRAADHFYSAAFCPPPSVYQPSAAGGVALGIICSALMTGQSTSPPLLTCVS